MQRFLNCANHLITFHLNLSSEGGTVTEGEGVQQKANVIS